MARRRGLSGWAAVSAAILIAFAFVSQSDGRTWTDCTGLHTTDAEIVSATTEVVTLRKPDGKTIKVPLDSLSPDDVKFVQKYIKQEQQSHRAPPDPANSKAEKQCDTVNDFFRKVRDQIAKATSEDTDVRVSAAGDTVVNNLQEEARKTEFTFRFPIHNVYGGGRRYVLALGSPEGIENLNGYMSSFAAMLTATAAKGITTDHVLVITGKGRLVSYPAMPYAGVSSDCVANIYVGQTNQLYGICISQYTWKTEREIHVKADRFPSVAQQSMPYPYGSMPSGFGGTNPNGFGGPLNFTGLPSGLPQQSTPNLTTNRPQQLPPVQQQQQAQQQQPIQPQPAVNPPISVQPVKLQNIPIASVPPTPPRMNPPPFQRRHEPIDLQLPCCKYVRDKLTPAKHDQRVARQKQLYGAQFDDWSERGQIWIGGYIDTVFWYYMATWTPARQAKWLWNYQNVIDPKLIAERRENQAVEDEYWKLNVARAPIDPYYVDSQFADDPDLMYTSQFVDTIYDAPDYGDNWSMPYSYLVAAVIAGMVLIVAWSKHEGYF
jgi:hypothetical protein